ncbi:MAG: PhzF family phenazine biosynthesis protein, partial [Bacteroidota bacterium]|nr:PhzF family phenazine biosynthesis protein [Bacteroidota bacterium]
MRYPIYKINAFSKGPFGGNPACVVPLTAWLTDEEMLAIAKENGV